MSEQPDTQARLEITAMPNEDALAALEALLFAAGDAVLIAELASVLDWSVADVRRHLNVLDEEYRRQRRGLTVQWQGERVQLTTAPRLGPLVSRWVSIERITRISDAALETLAIVAYRQPVTRVEIESVRGVDSSGVLSTLLARELVEVAGQRQGPGNPNEYRTTDIFLHHFGIKQIDELPGWGEESDDAQTSEP